jgi:N-acetylglucosaminyldiphosphoundecaprenol N-acetyl-beta-D-mannosaminyltransferase
MAVTEPVPQVADVQHSGPPQTRRRRFQRRTTTPRDRVSAQIESLPRVSLFDVPLVAVTYDEVADLVNRALADPASPAVTIDAVNTMGMSESCLDNRMHDALQTYDLVVPDGMPLVWCMNAKGAGLDDRVYGPYLTDRVLKQLSRRTRVAVIGGFSDVHEWLLEVGPTRYPNAEFTLLYDAPHGPIDEAYVDDCVRRIEQSRAELVFVCLAVPRQYYWTALAKPRLRRRVCISVGGAFDLICGAKKLAPAWMQRAGLTWLHRLAHEPKRLGPRYLKYNSAFLWLLLRREVLASWPNGRKVNDDVRRRQ